MSKQDKAKAKRAKKNKQIIYMMLAASLVVVAVMGFNIVRISLKKSAGSGEVVEKTNTSSMKNDQYVIGNNPTQFQQDEFKKLTEALKGDDRRRKDDQRRHDLISVVKEPADKIRNQRDDSGDHRNGQIQRHP